MKIFDKEYDGESVYDLQRDIIEAFDPDFNEEVKGIPQDEYGFQEGVFTVSIVWKNGDQPKTEADK